jgi:hypothetical protein
MEERSVARHTAGIIYLALAVMWTAIIAIMANIGSIGLSGILGGKPDSFAIIFITLCVYLVVSLLLAFLLLANFSFRARTLKLILALALLPLLAAPFSATDLFGAIVYLIPYFFTYKFYKEYQPVTETVKRHLRVIK